MTQSKNLHIIPTDKPSRLLLSKRGNLQFLKDNASLNTNNHYEGVYQNIYITNDEEIKEVDWALNIEENTIFKPSNDEIYDIKNSEAKYYEFIKKIILTDNKDLIKDGVQAIDDEFLQWFVKNPSCEEVEVQKWFDGVDFLEYKIIIPKEEPKQEYQSECICDTECRGFVNVKCKEPKQQETLEEAFISFMEINFSGQLTKGFVLGAMKFAFKWQQEKDKDFYFKYIKSEMDFQKLRIDKLGINTTNQIFEQQVTSLIHLAERSCSEEELKSAFKIGFNIGYGSPVNGLDSKDETCDVWFEQFKKK